MSNSGNYVKPYSDILGTEAQDDLEQSLASIIPNYKLYDEEQLHRWETWAKVSDALGMKRADFVKNIPEAIRQFLRRDLTNKIPEIPEAWWWIYFWRLTWNFHFEPDPWFESKWWAWMEVRGKQECLNMTGCQNCLGKNIPVMMADGSKKLSQDVRQGDLLMGPDGTPRRVLILHRGIAPLYKITPKIGSPWVCTGNHKLELECTRPRTNRSGSKNSKHQVGSRIKVTPEEWLQWSDAMKISYKQVHVGVDFPEEDLPVDPYIVGLWIGDGTKRSVSLTTADKEIEDEWTSYFKSNGYNVRCDLTGGGKAKTLHVSGGEYDGSKSKIKTQFSSFVKNGSKRIPVDYLRSSRKQRLELLAGIVDTDGSNAGTYIEIVQTDQSTAKDIVELAQSLGFLVNTRVRETNYVLKDGSKAKTNRINIIGDFRELPCRLDRKIPQKNYGKGCRKPQCTGFTVEPIGDGEFYGWTVDKDNMFLLGDGCVTNNSGKSMWAATFPLVQLIVWEQDCKSYLSGPYKSHTDDKVWAELQTQLAIVKNHGIPIKEAYGVELIENKNEILVKTDQGQGLIKFIASQEAASIIGSKTKDHSDTSGRKGISMLAIDEYVENTNTDFSRGFANFRSNYNSLLVLACNPDPSRALAASVSSFIMPIDKKPSEMRKGVDFRWRTSKGIVIRFAWQNCPNKIIGANRWKYLMNEQRKAKQEHEDDVVRAGQLDAWPFGGDGANTLTDAARQTAAGVFTQFYKLFDFELSVLALDPAFGGEDPAVYTIVDVGMVNVGGDEKKRIVAREQGIIQGIEADFIATPEFCEKVNEIIRYRQDRGDTETQFLETIRPGMKLGAMAQGAIEAAHLCISKGIRFDCFVYDASQRADCHDWIVKVFGHRNLVWWYEGSRNLRMEEGDDWFVWPVETRNDKFNMTQYVRWSEKYSRVITMIWSFACRMINAGYFANGDAVQRGLSELGARELHASNAGKMDIWSKADIKRGEFRGRKIPKMKSPAWGETLAISIYFAIRYKKAIDIHNHEVKHHIGATDGDWDQWLDIHSDY